MPCRDPKISVGNSFARATGALSLAALALALASCKQQAPERVANDVETQTPIASTAPATPVVSVPPPALTRGDLVSAAAQAASTYAGGEIPATPDPLVGRSFAVRLPFGCGAPAPVEASKKPDGSGIPEWSWGPERKTIQLHMMPSDWTGSAMLVRAGAADKWEAVEGFWIPRPWLASEGCPAVQVGPVQTGAAPASPQTLGLAAVFEVGGSRLGRRNGRAYEHTIRAKDDAPLVPPEGGFRMLLEGRIASFPSRRAIECHAASPDQRPVCIVAVQLDRVAYENGDRSILSEWRTG